MDFSGVCGVTARSSSPQAAMCRLCAATAEPVACASAVSLVVARSATLVIPQLLSLRSKDGPMPGMPRRGIICTNCAWRLTGMSSMPSGLALVDAIFATSLFEAMPTEQVM